MSPSIQKPCALLKLMAERRGSPITARDVAALLLAVRTMEALEIKLDQAFEAWREQANQSITASARSSALLDGMRALMEVHT